MAQAADEQRATSKPAQSTGKGAWRIWLRTARPFSLSASISPLLVGTAVAADQGVFRPLPFVAALVAGIFLQVGTNYFNEHFDYRYGLDSAESLGASTVIFTGELSARQVWFGGILSFAVAVAFGLLLVALVGPAILLFGLAALFIGYFYSARPFTFAKRGLGDPLVFVAMGVLMVYGAYYVQIPRLTSGVVEAFAASVAVGFLVVAILNMNNLRDYADDLAVGKLTLVARFGLLFGRIYQTLLVVGAYLATTAFAFTGVLPFSTVAVWLTFPLGYALVNNVLGSPGRRTFARGMKQISLLHLLFGVALATGLLLAAIAR